VEEKVSKVRLSVIVVLYNEFDLIKTCLKSIYENEVKGMETLVIDNSSDKNGHKAILKKFPKVKYFPNKENVGFGRAVNIGVKKSLGKYFLILTPDTYLKPNTIKPTLEYMENSPDAGLVTSRVYVSPSKLEASVGKAYPGIKFILYYYNMPFYRIIRRINPHYHPTTYKIGQLNKTIYAKYVMGAYMLLKKEAINKVGLFDPRFRLYMEDVDLCKRLNEGGWKVVYLPTGGLVNGEGSPWKTTNITQALPVYMNSLYLFIIKHKGMWYGGMSLIVGFLSSLISIPYLFFTAYIKRVFNKRSQSVYLLPLWIGIVKWHLQKGVKIFIKV
jgi:GT2 family glycosyltransferase